VEAHDRLAGIIAFTEQRTGREIRASQQRGELAKAGQYDRGNLPEGKVCPATLSDVGLTYKQSSDHQELADARSHARRARDLQPRRGGQVKKTKVVRT
jgi:hypothetical protein